MHRVRTYCFLITTLVFSALVVPAIAAGIAEKGKEVATKWCATCHIVTAEQTTGSADVPTFKFIAEKYDNQIEALGAFLADPHPPMPKLSLSRREIRDIVAYLESLNQSD